MLKVAIIGSGFGLYGLLPAFNSLRKCRVTAICGSKHKRLVNYCSSIGLKNIYTDWRLMLKKEKIDVLAIAVPPPIQYEISKVAIKKGINIFAEKPLAANYRQALNLFYLAEKKGIKHGVDFIFPQIKEWEKVKDLIDNKKYGKLLEFTANWDFLSYDIKNKKSGWKTSVAGGGGALSYYFCHTLHYLEYFTGKISNLKSSLQYSKEGLNGGEIGIDLSLKFQNGVKGKAHLNCNNKYLNKHRLIFKFEKASITLENIRTSVTNFVIKIQRGNKTKKLTLNKEKNKRGEDKRVKIVKKLASAFIDACIKNKEFTPSFKEGVRVQQLIEKVRRQQV